MFNCKDTAIISDMLKSLSILYMYSLPTLLVKKIYTFWLESPLNSRLFFNIWLNGMGMGSDNNDNFSSGGEAAANWALDRI